MKQDSSAGANIDLAATTLAALLQRYTGDLIVGLHLVGSAADGDFCSGRSDLDFVAVLSRLPTGDDVEALGILHRSYGSDPTFPKLDGIWVTPDELATGPDAIADGPTSHDGEFVRTARGNRNPVTWFAMMDGVPLIGELDRAALWQDRARLIGWVKENAQGYWRRWLVTASSFGTPTGLAMLGRAMPMWGVLGISRLAHTAATGKIASKSAAGEWAIETFGESRIVREALACRQRHRSAYASPVHRRRDALAFVEMMISKIAES